MKQKNSKKKDIRFEDTETQEKHATRDEKLTVAQHKKYWKILNRCKKTKQLPIDFFFDFYITLNAPESDIDPHNLLEIDPDVINHVNEEINSHITR